MHDPKLKRIFEIAQADFKIIQGGASEAPPLSTFIHITKHLNGATGTLYINIIDFSLPLSLFKKLPKWHFFTHA